MLKTNSVNRGGPGNPINSLLVDQFGDPLGVPGNPLNVGAIVVPTPLDVVLVGGGLNFDPAMMDAFGRMRTSEPVTLFDSKQIFNDQSIYFLSDTATGGTVTWQSARASSYLTVTTTNGSLAARQTKRYFNYQPGKSQQIFMTFVMGAADATLRQRAGYFDANNGIFLQQVAAGKSLVLRTNITGAPSDANAVTQNNWNLDPLNGFGPSGITLDLTKGQVMVIDFEWLGLGLVRVGFVLETRIVYAHVFQNPNSLANVYMTTSNLPVRWEIARIAGGAVDPAVLEAVCCSVVSEGGQQPVGAPFGADRAVASVSVPTATYVSVIAIRLKAGQLRRTVIPLNFQLHDTVAAGTVNYRLLFNPTRGAGAAAVWSSAHADSSVEFDVTSTQALTGGHDLTGGYAQGRITDIVSELPNQITLGAQDIAGTVPDELVLAARSFGGSADACLGAINWVEL